MTGTLGLFSLVDLFQLLSAARRTGRLTVEHPVGRARIYFDRGKAVHAEFGELTGTDAVYTLFADERGAFEFRLGLPSPANTIEVGTENLVLEAMRRLDEVDRGRAPRQEGAYGGLTVSRDAVPAVPDAVPGEQREFALNAEELALMSQVDGQRTITRIAINLGRDPDELRVVCERLVRTGVLKLQHRRARTARLVTRLANRRLPPGTVGVDAGILSAWEKALGASVVEVACRRSGGGVTLFPVKALEGIGPYLELTRDALVRADLRVNETLLVRPVTDPT
ncbi:MAG: DUF4388 domain-containing protein [Deinococcales bacterium]|nr:DUF4388 domain-containing protein [Deinococcales bacterium]